MRLLKYAIVISVIFVSFSESQAQEQAEDLLTFARGAVFISQTGLASGSSGSALLAINGDPYRMSLTSDANGPVEFTYLLPAATTFTRFGVPNVIEQPGNTTFVRDVTVSGSSQGPEGDYQRLAAFTLETHGPDETVTWLESELTTPVRWIRIGFDNGINIEPGDEGKTVLWFSELIGLGEQEPTPMSDAFSGAWQLRSPERLDLNGLPFELEQSGSMIRGCYNDVPLSGNVNGRIARVTGESANGRTTAMVLVADDDGVIHASVSERRGRFRAMTAVNIADEVVTECEPPSGAPQTCGTNAYINFDYDSATIRNESESVLDDVYAGLSSENAANVAIIGHTSTEGDETYNLNLSAERARSVVAALVARGFDSSRIRASGQGESQPLITPDASETARELNRRVEISCDAPAAL